MIIPVSIDIYFYTDWLCIKSLVILGCDFYSFVDHLPTLPSYFIGNDSRLSSVMVLLFVGTNFSGFYKIH